MEGLIFREAEQEDVDTILYIYNYYILSTTATFDLEEVSREEMLQRIFIEDSKYPTFIIENFGATAGFCFLTRFRRKRAYDRTAEIGLYLKPEFTGKGIGKITVKFLEKEAVSRQIRVIIASLSGENNASIRLFNSLNYKKCAHYKKIGEKFGRILDIIDFQKFLVK